MLEVKDLTVRYGGALAVDCVSLTVGPDELVALVGPNGAGKTTLLKTISGVLRAASGSIHFNGVSISADRPDRIVRSGIAHCPEGRRLGPELTVGENLDLGAYTRRDLAEIKHDLVWVYELFPKLWERRHQLAGTLSGGEQQMAAVGRALMARPRLLMLDEPSLGLAPLVKTLIFDTLLAIRARGVGMLLVEQDSTLALGVADRGYVIETGRIVRSGRDLLHDDHVRRTYLGI